MKQASIPVIARWVWDKTGRCRVRIVVACLIGLLRVAAGLSFVWVSKLIVDAATSHNAVSSDYLIHMSVLLAALMIVEMLLSLTVNYITNQTEARMRNTLRYDIYSKLLTSRWDSDRTMHSGDLLNRITEDVRVIVDVMCRKLQETVVMLVQLVGAFCLLFFLSAKLALCVLLILPLFIVLSKIYVRKTRSLTAQIRLNDSEIHTSMQEGLQHHVVVQTLECEPQVLDGVGALQQRLYDVSMSRTRFSTFSRGMVRIGFIAGYLLAFIWSVWHLHMGLITFGTMTAFLQLVARIQNPMFNLTQYVPALVQSLTSTDRLLEIESLPDDNKSQPRMLAGKVGVSFDNVTFAYPHGSHNVFDNFSYDFPPGSKTVVMGETGVGKSTLVRLILALLYPQKGHIKLYSTDTQVDVSADTRCNMVYVPQGNSLLEGTVRDNLRLGDPDATDAEMCKALHTAAADFVMELPAGLDTPCGELGSALSEGQAQRIAIARGLLRKGSVMLLDEFNSALDSATAATMMSRITDAHPDSTIIFISHRAEVADYCDRTLTLSR